MTQEELWKKILSLGGRQKVENLMLGYCEVEVLDASSGNATPSTIENCRGISCDTEGIVKIDYVNPGDGSQEFTEVMTLKAGIVRPVRNVTRLYQYYTGTTDGTAESYGADGVAITNAIKIYR